MRTLSALRWAAGVVALVTMSACAADETPADSTNGGANGQILIGASLELSGPTASIGTAYRKALELKVQQLNDADVLGGRTLKLVIQDNQTKPDVAIQVVNGLIKNDKVSAVIEGGCSACAVANDKTVESRKVPTIALASASAITSPAAAHPYTFKVSPSPADDAAVIVSELKHQGVTSIGLLNVNNVYGQEGRTAVTAEAARQGITVVQAEQFGQTDKDMTVQLRKIAAKKPNAIVTWAVSPAASQVATTVKAIGYPGGLYLDAGAGAELYVQGAQKAAENTRMVFVRTLAGDKITGTDPASTTQKTWYDDYTKAYGPYSGFASFGADALQMIADAIIESGGTDPAAIRDALENMGIDGASGRIQNSPGNHSGLQPAALAVLEVSDGKWQIAN